MSLRHTCLPSNPVAPVTRIIQLSPKVIEYHNALGIVNVKPGSIALDVGANIDFYTIPLAIQAKAIGSKIVAFEPLESNAAWLRHNLGGICQMYC